MKLGLVGSEVDIPTPKFGSFQIEPQELARKGRLTSGRMVKDRIALKNKFVLSYPGLKAAQVQIFIGYHAAGQPVNFIYDDAGVSKNTMVYITEIPRETSVLNPQYSKNVQVVMEEV